MTIDMSKRIVGRQIRRVALDIGERIFSKTLDATLWWVTYLQLLPIAVSMHEPTWKAWADADRLVSAIGYEPIKRAITKARKRGFLTKTRRFALPAITEAGRKRVAALVPVYDPIRLWDGRLHLVTYDIPEKRAEDRRLLRDYLRAIRCGRLQDSVWMTPYNPVDLVREYIAEHSLSGTIIVSDIGKDGSVGDEDVKNLIVRVYELEKINARYEEWIAEVERYGKADHWAILEYFSVLKDDPQLPFALLPKWWKGEEAYQLVKEDLVEVSKFFRPENK